MPYIITIIHIDHNIFSIKSHGLVCNENSQSKNSKGKNYNLILWLILKTSIILKSGKIKRRIINYWTMVEHVPNQLRYAPSQIQHKIGQGNKLFFRSISPPKARYSIVGIQKLIQIFFYWNVNGAVLVWKYKFWFLSGSLKYWSGTVKSGIMFIKPLKGLLNYNSTWTRSTAKNEIYFWEP